MKKKNGKISSQKKKKTRPSFFFRKYYAARLIYLPGIMWSSTHVYLRYCTLRADFRRLTTETFSSVTTYIHFFFFFFFIPHEGGSARPPLVIIFPSEIRIILANFAVEAEKSSKCTHPRMHIYILIRRDVYYVTHTNIFYYLDRAHVREKSAHPYDVLVHVVTLWHTRYSTRTLEHLDRRASNFFFFFNLFMMSQILYTT